jgi:hypothetical protein
MSASRFDNRARLLSVAAFVAIWIGLTFAPARADETAAVRAREGKQRSTAALTLPGAPAIAGVTRGGSNVTNGFVYLPGVQPALGFRGRVNVGRSGVYVPYYGDVGIDPAHPNVQGMAGIGYGFRGFDISVYNGGLSAGAAPGLVPGGVTGKANPSVSVSVRF